MKKVLGILLILVVIMQANLSIAATTKEKELQGEKQEMTNQQKDNAQKEKELKQDIKEIEEKKSNTLKEVEQLIDNISSYESDIEELQQQINKLQSDIDDAEKGIKEKEEQYAKEKALLDERLLTICESGETQYLDVLLDSENILDFISKYYMISELVQSDTELLESIEEQRKGIEAAKAKYESDKKELDTKQEELEKKNNELKSAKSQKDAQVKKLNAEEKEAQEALEETQRQNKEIEQRIKKLEEEIKKEKAKNNVANIAGKPSASGYIFPVSGLSKNNINNKNYPSYSGHTGVDINLNVVGKKVVAVKDGTVVISEAKKGSIKNYDSNGNYIGSYSGYGEYVLINHYDGTMTLYGHMKPGTRTVKEGDKVKQGQVLGTVGNTGNCQPRPTPSNPLNGTHLHFEVRINGKPVNPLPYLP